MKKHITAIILFLSIAACGFGQRDKNKPLEKLDTLALLKEMEVAACKCVAKIPTAGKGMAEITDSVSNCIKTSMNAFSLTLQMHQALMQMKDATIVMDNGGSADMRKYRSKMEFWLRDSCPALVKMMSTNEKASEHSYSTNDDALAEFNKGVESTKDKDYEMARVHYKKAVAIDPVFGFAWDNLAVSNRRLGRWDESIAAYRRSLSIDPEGLTALHNLPVVYQLKKDFDSALIEFRHLATIFPKDPEAFYGAGNIYIYDKEDLETGLDYMCKAYILYGELSSPYRVDAEKRIAYVYNKLKDAGKETVFDKILKDNDIKFNK